MMLAQLQSADPVHVWNILLVIGFFLSSGASWVAIAGSRRAQKREVSLLPDLVTRGECDIKTGQLDQRVGKVESDMSVLREEMQRQWHELDRADEARASELHKRLNELNSKLEQKFQDMPAQITSTLLNTKQLWRDGHNRP